MSHSLWFVPYDNNPFRKTVQELISDTVPRNFVSEDKIQHFVPHVTVTSDIDSDKVIGSKSPQEWLDQLELPEFKAEFDEVLLQLDTVEAEDPVFRKMNISVKENANLTKFAAACRRQTHAIGESEAQQWAEHDYRPHMSLLYADVPTRDAKGKIPLIEMKIGFAFGDLFACCGGSLCMGGYLDLVDTSKPVAEWKTIARRETPYVMWRATRNLI